MFSFLKVTWWFLLVYQHSTAGSTYIQAKNFVLRVFVGMLAPNDTKQLKHIEAETKMAAIFQMT